LRKVRLQLPRRENRLPDRHDGAVRVEVKALVVAGVLIVDLGQRKVCRSAAVTAQRLHRFFPAVPVDESGHLLPPTHCLQSGQTPLTPRKFSCAQSTSGPALNGTATAG